MEKTAVESSSLAWVGYVAATRLLVVGFVRGTVYEFVDVPMDEYEALMSAASKGQQFNRRVKGRYAHRRVSGRARWN